MNLSRILILLFFLSNTSIAQNDAVSAVIQELNDNSPRQVLHFVNAEILFSKMDSAVQLKLLQHLEKNISGKSQNCLVKFQALRARILFYLPSGTFNEDTSKIVSMKQALQQANLLNNPYMIAAFSRYYGEMLLDKNKKEEALQYCINAITLMENLDIENFNNVKALYLTLGELFYKVKLYPQAIKYFTKGIKEPNSASLDNKVIALSMNTFGLAYREIKKYDSSLYRLEQCMHFCDSLKIYDWYAYAHDNRFDAFLALGKYDSCINIANIAYEDGMTDTAAGILMIAHWQYGTVALAKNDYSTALTHFHKSIEFRNKISVNAYDIKIFKGIAEVYDALAYSDKALIYYKKYKQSQDSLDNKDKIINENYLFAKANFEKEQLIYKQNELDKKQSITIRNVSILLISCFALLIIWLLNKKRKKSEIERQLAELNLQKFWQNAEAKFEELQLLKNKLINEAHSKTITDQIVHLSEQVILTEEDWRNFQSNFEQAFPGFIMRVKNKVPQVTEAELRMALLIKLKLNTKQMAAMQGISTDGVHKSRQRLKSRLSIVEPFSLEDTIANL